MYASEHSYGASHVHTSPIIFHFNQIFYQEFTLNAIFNLLHNWNPPSWIFTHRPSNSGGAREDKGEETFKKILVPSLPSPQIWVKSRKNGSFSCTKWSKQMTFWGFCPLKISCLLLTPKFWWWYCHYSQITCPSYVYSWLYTTGTKSGSVILTWSTMVMTVSIRG